MSFFLMMAQYFEAFAWLVAVVFALASAANIGKLSLLITSTVGSTVCKQYINADACFSSNFRGSLSPLTMASVRSLSLLQSAPSLTDGLDTDPIDGGRQV